jgi:hypothetical protein
MSPRNLGMAEFEMRVDLFHHQEQDALSLPVRVAALPDDEVLKVYFIFYLFMLEKRGFVGEVNFTLAQFFLNLFALQVCTHELLCVQVLLHQQLFNALSFAHHLR